MANKFDEVAGLKAAGEEIKITDEFIIGSSDNNNLAKDFEHICGYSRQEAAQAVFEVLEEEVIVF